jgi:hypothetical protein
VACRGLIRVDAHLSLQTQNRSVLFTVQVRGRSVHHRRAGGGHRGRHRSRSRTAGPARYASLPLSPLVISLGEPTILTFLVILLLSPTN